MHQKMLRGIPGLYPPEALAPLHTQSYDNDQKCLQTLPGEEGRTTPMLRTVGLGKGGAGRTQLRVDTLRAQTDEGATCALGPRVGLGCWLSNRKAWQEWEDPGSRGEPAKHTLTYLPALSLEVWAFSRMAALRICVRARPGTVDFFQTHPLCL